MHYERLVKAAASAKVDVLLFPELSLTGYEPDISLNLAIEKNDTRLQPLQELSDQHSMTIIVGAPLKVANGRSAIGALIISYKQEIRVYKKIHLHPGDSDYFSQGSTEFVFSAHNVNLGLAICADAGQPISM